MLISSDVGVETTVKIIRRIEERVARDKYMNASELQSILRGEIATLMEDAHGSSENFGLDATEGQPYVVMVVGVNGAGKTTTIGKLAAQLTKAGRKVWIGAADTFRAAAIDQLQVTQATQVTSLTITKLDGTAKGGVVIGISDQFHIPVRYIGIGEGIDQLRIFDRKEFVNALFGHEKN